MIVPPMDEYEMDKCPLWNVDCKVSLLGGDNLSYLIDSPRAGGNYLIDFELYHQLKRNLLPLTDTVRTLLTTWLVDRRKDLERSGRLGNLVRLQRDVVERAIEGKMKKLSPKQRVRRLLFKLANMRDKGEWFQVIGLERNPALLAETESINHQDAAMLIDRLIELKLVDQGNDSGLREVRVSFEGHEVVDGDMPIDMKEIVSPEGILSVNPVVFEIPESTSYSDVCPLVAIMMPFHKKYDGVHRVIKDVCDKLDLIARRADDMWQHPTIIQDIFTLLYQADVVVAEFTGSNPNVLYETGIAHTLGRTVIPITQNIKDVPFDMRHHRVIQYVCDEEGLNGLYHKLSNKLKQMFATAW